MSQPFQEEGEIERRKPESKPENSDDKIPNIPKSMRESLEVIDTKIKRYSIIVYAIAFATGILQFAYFTNLYYFIDVLQQRPRLYIKATCAASYPWIIKPLFGYLHDSHYLAGFRSKHPFIISSLSGAFASALLFFTRPTVASFSFYYLLLNLSVIISDIMAKGLSTIIKSLNKTKDEILEEAREQSGSPPKVEKGHQRKKIFGSYTLRRFVIRNIGKLLGGILVNIISFNTMYGVIACIQIGVLCLLLTTHETGDVKWFNPKSDNVITRFFVRRSENFGLYTKICIGSVSGAVASLLYYRFAMDEDRSFVELFGLQILGALFQKLNFELFLRAFTGHSSSDLPRGIKSFYSTAVIALMNFCSIQFNLFGPIILDHFGIGNGTHAQVIFPIAINFCCTMGALLLTPVLGK